ncbi:MAG: hypothetical protein R2787_11255 [Saprospiraceae bacterium]
MKKIHFMYGILLACMTMTTACFTPINTTFDSARLLDRGEIEIQGSGSLYHYYGAKINDPVFDANRNLGAAIGIGLSDRINMRLRYEYLKSGFSSNLFGEEIRLNDIQYMELSGKVRLIKDKLALTMPLGVYSSNGASFYSIDPRLTYTYRLNNLFEASLIPKVHLLFVDGEAAAMPGVSVGFGISSNLDKWAIRPEFGYDTNIVFGVGVSYYVNPWRNE